MPPELIYAALVTGLAGGIHCLGMCGGIVAVISTDPGSVFPVNVEGLARGARSPARARPGRAAVWRPACYHAGRLCTYALLGAVAGALGSTVMLARYVLPVQQAMYGIAAVMLVLMGVHLLGFPTPPLGWVERGGARAWAYLRPSAHALLKGTSVRRALLAGLVWGTVPCALVYSTLTLALLAGGALSGALVMLAFGLGTTPHLAFGGFAMRKASRLLSRHGWRRFAGVTLIALAATGLLRGLHVDVLGSLSAWCTL